MLDRINLPVMCKHFRYTSEAYGCAIYGECKYTVDWKQCKSHVAVARAGFTPIQPIKKAAVVEPCPYRGAPTGETVLCPTCRGGQGTRLALYACSKHGVCTIDPQRSVDGVHCCGAS